MASNLFAAALNRAGQRDAPSESHDAGVLALAIDPLFSPALLTVGSIEYQYGRVDAAMALFLTLTSLPEKEPDLAELIDKAGCFLLDQNDNPNAARLYRAATEAYPEVCEHWSSLSYCIGKRGEMVDAVAAARKALALNENNPQVLNDLGWTLVLAGLYEQAKTILQRAAVLAPAGYALPRNNLLELEKRTRLKRGTKKE